MHRCISRRERHARGIAQQTQKNVTCSACSDFQWVKQKDSLLIHLPFFCSLNICQDFQAIVVNKHLRRVFNSVEESFPSNRNITYSFISGFTEKSALALRRFSIQLYIKRIINVNCFFVNNKVTIVTLSEMFNKLCISMCLIIGSNLCSQLSLANFKCPFSSLVL